MRKLVNLVGRRFSRLVVLSEEKERDNSGYVKYLCRCDCGNHVSVRGSSLKSGSTLSCGCLNRERFRYPGTHGLSRSKEYFVWTAMRARAKTKKITVCEEWRDDPMAFIKWLKENGYSEGSVFGRIDLNGPFAPHNCEIRLTGKPEICITVGEKTKNISDWALYIGVNKSTISRHAKAGDAEDYISRKLIERKQVT